MSHLLTTIRTAVIFLYSLMMVFVLFHPANANGIETFEADITLHKDGSLSVQEKVIIRVYEPSMENGFERILPAMTWLENEQNISVTGEERSAVIKVMAAYLNNKPITFKLSPYHADIRGGEFGSNAKLKLAPEMKSLQPGLYTFEYQYSISGQIGYHEKREWLNWNVTRNRYSSDIDNVDVTVHIPHDINIDQVKASALQSLAVGANKEDGRPKKIDSHTFVFQNQTQLDGRRYIINLVFPFQSFDSDYRRKIKFWQSDYIKTPLTSEQKTKEISVALGSCIFLCLLMFILLKKQNNYSLTAEFLIKTFSPAAIGFYVAGNYHSSLFLASLINLAREKLITINSSSENDVQIKKNADGQSHYNDDAELFSRIFRDGSVVSNTLIEDTPLLFPLLAKNHQRVLQKIDFFSSLPERNFSKPLITGLLLSFIIFIINLFNVHTDMPLSELFGISLFIFIFSSGALLLFVFNVFLPFLNAQELRLKLRAVLSFNSFFIMIFIFIAVYVINEFISQVGWIFVFTFIGIIFLNILFAFLLMIYSGVTKRSFDVTVQQLMVNMKGNKIRIYTQDDYLKYLAYAYAFNIDRQWVKNFQGSLLTGDCPDFTSPELWTGGTLQPLYKKLDMFLHP